MYYTRHFIMSHEQLILSVHTTPPLNLSINGNPNVVSLLSIVHCIYYIFLFQPMGSNVISGC